MKVTLNIEQDAELRSVIKDAIKGQVMSVTREEITSIVKEEIQKKVQNSDVQYLNRLIGDSMKSVIADILYKEHDVDSWHNKWMDPIITKYLDSKVSAALKGKNWDSIIDTLAKKKLQDMIK